MRKSSSSDHTDDYCSCSNIKRVLVVYKELSELFGEAFLIRFNGLKPLKCNCEKKKNKQQHQQQQQQSRQVEPNACNMQSSLLTATEPATTAKSDKSKRLKFYGCDASRIVKDRHASEERVAYFEDAVALTRAFGEKHAATSHRAFSIRFNVGKQREPQQIHSRPSANANGGIDENGSMAANHFARMINQPDGVWIGKSSVSLSAASNHHHHHLHRMSDKNRYSSIYFLYSAFI